MPSGIYQHKPRSAETEKRIKRCPHCGSSEGFKILGCGLPKFKLTENVSVPTRPAVVKNTAKSGNNGDPNKQLHTRDPERHIIVDVKTKGYCSCKCNAGFESGIVLDPFSGAGTTALVAKKLGRGFVGIELNREYVRMSEKRLNQIEQPLF